MFKVGERVWVDGIYRGTVVAFIPNGGSGFQNWTNTYIVDIDRGIRWKGGVHDLQAFTLLDILAEAAEQDAAQ